VKLAAQGSRELPSAHAEEAGDARRAQLETWGLVAIALGLFAVARFAFGPLPQNSAYHFFADTRTLGPIPRAADVLTNAAILAAGLAALALRRRVHIAADERPAYALLVFATLATALGSAWYHAAPGDARLVWDRLPMTLVLAAVFALVLGDRVHPAFARAAWWPFALAGIASVLWWAWTGRDGSGGDLLLYVAVRAVAGLGIVSLLLFRRGRHTHTGWFVAAMMLGIVMTVSEAMDREIFAATHGIISGHSTKHLIAGAMLGCVVAWLALRSGSSEGAARA
jgi:hypothetical protein